MSIGIMLSNLAIGPLKLLFEVLFSLADKVLNEGLSIVALSLAVNFLVLPLYQRADAVQREAREKEKQLAPRIKRIKAAFRGDEQYMMLQTYYRQNHYSPLHVLKGAVPLLLQIPFFLAAYQFLSRLGCLEGAAFGPIRDLSRPDGLLRMGGAEVNLLPILMTVFNLLSGALVTRDAPLKSKIQLWAMALVFLVLLYGSPAGLTFYWMLNNLFSLVKNLIRPLLPGRREKSRKIPGFLLRDPSPGCFFLCMLAVSVLLGLMIPSSVLSASPQEFLDYVSYPDPIWYAVQAFLLSSGTFLLWLGIYYALAGRTAKKVMETGSWVLLGCCLINAFFFRRGLGLISSTLIYDRAPAFLRPEKLLNLAVLAAAAALLIFLFAKKERLVRSLALAAALAMTVVSGKDLAAVQGETAEVRRVQARNIQGEKEIPLSREGNNVIVLMLDRAISSYLPCILQERPDLKEVYSGFVYYPNTLSFGKHTNWGSPALFGGYDYTPEAMNARSDVLLKDKHNEALMLLPTLFSREGYRVSVFDVPYPGDYTDTGDYSVFDGLQNTNARTIRGEAEPNGMYEQAESLRMRNFFCYSLAMTAPSALFDLLYDGGSYNKARGSNNMFSPKGSLQAYGDLELRPEFMKEYEVLESLNGMTRVLEEEQNTLLVMCNKTTHQPTLLPEPEYAPVRKADNEAYDEAHRDRFSAGPFPLISETEEQMAHYQVNMAALIRVGDWLRTLKESGVYDRTRIIIASDHGFQLRQIQEGITEDGEDLMAYNPLLMVKDFGAEGEIRTDTRFMTNADVPSLALEGLISDPVNPFTGNPVTRAGKEADQYVSTSWSYETGRRAGTTFDAAQWFRVTPGGETVFDLSRWELLPEWK